MANYPIPKFHFQVEWGGTKSGFTEVTGLEVSTEVIEYRHGASPEYHKVKMPGMQKFSNITMKRGTFRATTIILIGGTPWHSILLNAGTSPFRCLTKNMSRL